MNLLISSVQETSIFPFVPTFKGTYAIVCNRAFEVNQARRHVYFQTCKLLGQLVLILARLKTSPRQKGNVLR